jgi:hypothetical protein
MDISCANYREQRRIFCTLFETDNPLRILFFHGKPGCGKTTLLQTCIEKDLPAGIRPIKYNFKNFIELDEILDRVVDELGHENMPSFTKEISSLWRINQNVTMDKICQDGTGNLINVYLALQTTNHEERDQRRKYLARAWFDDLRNAPPIIFVMDTYEKAGEEVRNWVECIFLERVRRTPNIYVLIAGQQTPDDHNVEWGHCCTAKELPGVHSAEDWLPVARALNRCVPSKEWLAGVCHALKGQPDEILTIIQDLPYERNAV